MTAPITDRPSARKRTLAGAAAAVALSALGLGLSASPASAATFTTGHTDIVSVACSSTGAVTISTFREDVGTISPGTIGNQTFVYDDSNAPAAAITYASNVWTASGDEAYEDAIPFIGFQYASAGSQTLCPSSVTIDVAKVSGSTNTGNAVFTANDAVSGSTSSAAGNTSRVRVWRPGSGLGPSHEHGKWTFGGPATGGTYNLQFTAYRLTGSTAIGTISPAHITVQP